MDCTCREIGGSSGFSSVMLIDDKDSFASAGDFLNSVILSIFTTRWCAALANDTSR